MHIQRRAAGGEALDERCRGGVRRTGAPIQTLNFRVAQGGQKTAVEPFAPSEELEVDLCAFFDKYALASSNSWRVKYALLCVLRFESMEGGPRRPTQVFLRTTRFEKTS